MEADLHNAIGYISYKVAKKFLKMPTTDSSSIN